MIVSTLYFLRQLKKEKEEIERRRKESYGLNRESNRQYLESLLKEVKEEISIIEPVIIRWIDESAMYEDQKKDCKKFFVDGCKHDDLDNPNFTRDLQHHLYKCFARHRRTRD